MRIEPVIAINGSDAVGPTRIRLHTASTAKLPVVITTHVGDSDLYYMYGDIAALQSALTNQAATSTVDDALRVNTPPRLTAAVASTDITGTEAGTPVVDGGQLIGITAPELQEQDEPTDPKVAAANDPAPHVKFKRALRKRRSTRTENRPE